MICGIRLDDRHDTLEWPFDESVRQIEQTDKDTDDFFSHAEILSDRSDIVTSSQAARSGVRPKVASTACT